MGIEDLGKQASDFVGDNAEKVKDALGSEEAEGISDKALDGAADLADKVTGGKFSDHIDSARDAIDDKIGNE